MPRLRILLASAALVAASALAAGGEEPDGDASGVRAAFDAYRAAILAGDGRAAAELVSPATIGYFGELQQAALYASSNEVRAQPLVNQLRILTFRHRVDADLLKEMTPRDLFVFSVERGWVARSSAQALEAGQVAVAGDVATVAILTGGQATGLAYRFEREGGAWRLDLLPLLTGTSQALAALAEKEGVSEEELIVQLLETSSRRPAPAAVWEPLFPKPGEGG